MKAVGMMFAVLLSLPAQAATYAELVAKEEGVDFGECELKPRPKMKGEKIYITMPARFEDPQVWQTKDLWFVGVTNGEVLDKIELKMSDGFNPRESNVKCAKNIITVTEETRGKGKPKKRRYKWDGKKLSAVS